MKLNLGRFTNDSNTAKALLAIIKVIIASVGFSVVFDNGEREKVKINRYFKIINTVKILTSMNQHLEFSWRGRGFIQNLQQF